MIEEADEQGRTQLSATLQGSLLDEYAEEKAGIVDLLNDSAFAIAGAEIDIKVDFDRLKQTEIESLGPQFPRKDYDGS